MRLFDLSRNSLSKRKTETCSLHQGLFLLWLSISTLQIAVFAKDPTTSSGSSTMNTMGKIHIVFSDVDGTLVHYPSKNTDDPDNIVLLPPSSTGMQGEISHETLRLCDLIRRSPILAEKEKEEDDKVEQCTKLVLVSGMRTTTLFQRLPFLPLSDAYCSENGGRIFYPVRDHDDDDDDKEDDATTIPTDCSFTPPQTSTKYRLVEDLKWRQIMSVPNAAGSDGYPSSSVKDQPPLPPIQQRKGTLWKFATSLMNDGWVLDDKGYATCFRIHSKKQPAKVQQQYAQSNSMAEDIIQKCRTQNLQDSLTITVNLGCVDVYPKCSGKRAVCQYLAEQQQPSKLFGSSSSSSSLLLSKDCVCLCDDDNDLDMALGCRLAFVPTITSESMRKVMEQNEDQIISADRLFSSSNKKEVVQLGTTGATDAILRKVLNLCTNTASSSSLS